MTLYAQEMTRTLANLTMPFKGILAADESSATIEKHFKAMNVPFTEQTRRDYRELLFSTPNLSDFISGVIMFDETIKQKTHANLPLIQLLTEQGIVPGIKADMGAVQRPSFPGEKVTQGLDGLCQRLKNYKQLGARFAKWRGVIAIGKGIPTSQTISVNAHALACYAFICQKQGIVPIVEPEVLMDGGHTLATSASITEEVLQAVFHALDRQHVILKYMLLKPNMVLPGIACSEQASPEQVAQATLKCLRRTVPAAVPGIYFLSGGQSEISATVNLNAINAERDKYPWILSFSYGRALQLSALNAWRGENANITIAQQLLYKRACLNSAACEGKYNLCWMSC